MLSFDPFYGATLMTRVLIIDDEENILKTLSGILKDRWRPQNTVPGVSVGVSYYSHR
jgi:DNA-binding NtrC family response regulator